MSLHDAPWARKIEGLFAVYPCAKKAWLVTPAVVIHLSLHDRRQRGKQEMPSHQWPWCCQWVLHTTPSNPEQMLANARDAQWARKIKGLFAVYPCARKKAW